LALLFRLVVQRRCGWHSSEHKVAGGGRVNFEQGLSAARCRRQ
jgi:hypothetical protein